ncbi:MAG: heparinase, partial [Muribaculaceae bacterium]|nr:heparinase [Muribaculaceae bacterium]
MRRLLTTLLLIVVIYPIWAANISHPSLLFTPQRIEEAKKMMKADPARETAWKSILKQADELLEKNDVRKMEYLALAYQMTGEQRYGDKLRTMLLDIAKIPSWGDSEMMMREPAWRSELQMAHKSFQIAVAYDAVYNMLTQKERKEIAQGVWRLAGEPLLGDWILEGTGIHSLNSMGHNWWTSCVGMGGLLALAISNELSEAASAAKIAVESLPEWFEFEGDEIQGKPRTFDRDGGMYESINYASFGITEALLLRMAWLNSHPGAKLPEIKQMELLPSFFSHVCYPREGMLYSINFGDSHKNVTGESSMALAYAMGVKDPVTLWYISQVEPNQHREGFP